ncbi:MAG: PQQ-binding-like beta-propeller repeat protein [Planctomycetota bacterium]
MPIHRMMLSLIAAAVFALHSPSLNAAPPLADARDQAAAILRESGVQGGFAVHLGAGTGDIAAALQAAPGFQVQGLEADPAAVAAGRQRLLDAGQYGHVSLLAFTGQVLPYIDNMVNLLVVEPGQTVPQDELLRVVVPGGSLLIRQPDGSFQKISKPRPDTIDEWSHYLHDATGNAVAHDDVVGSPRHLQWVGSPRWSRHHDRMASMSALVSTNGRLFYIMDEGSRISIQLPSRWKLIARDAFNGVILWKRDIANWQNQLWPLKSGPTQLSRRLVSTDREVYAPLSENGPLEALDAATGQTLRTYVGTDGVEEVLHVSGTLFVVVRKGAGEREQYAPANGRVGDQGKVAQEFFWNEEPRVIMAFEAATGRQLWARQTRIAPLTLASTPERLLFHDGESLNALQPDTGNLLWTSAPVTRRRQFTFNFGPRLVIWQDVVLYAGGDGRMLSVEAATGKQLWEAEHPNSGYQSPQDLMVVDGLVWCAPTTSGKDTGVFTGRDPRTGAVKKEFAPDVDTYWFHHRCYIAKATDNFLIPSRTGVEFVDFEKEHWDIHHWVRGGCLYGVLPCNGLTYTPPHNCACYPEAKLFGFNALAPAAPSRPIPKDVPEAGRHETGPAFGTPLAAETEFNGEDDWPTFRHDSRRSGTSRQDVPATLNPRWSMDLGGQLTSPVIAAGIVYVARSDAHTLYALQQSDGSKVWSFTAGARIDSPPTIARGRAVFGGTDGWVYCLNASDGQLVWKYRAAPIDRRAMAFEQLESLWPVHGSVLVRNNEVWSVAGRSNFLDGGLRLLRLDLETGRRLSETVMDETNPETGNNLQEKLKILQMPVGLPDILVADEQLVYMKSQKFDPQGQRLEIGPVSGDFVEQGSAQRGDGVHLFAPMGFLDDSWFHRSYWVYGRNFAGGHGGYYQAGRFAPSGDILVNGNGYVFGYGRKPEYFRWTTTMERQLYSAAPEAPEIPDGFAKSPQGGGKKKSAADDGQFAQFPKAPALDPAGKPITVEAWITATAPNGVIVARGGPAEGFALSLETGKPAFHVRSANQLSSVIGSKRIVGGWHHVAGVLAPDRSLKLYVDGELVGEGKASALISKDPAQGLEIGNDAGSTVSDNVATQFVGIIDEVRLYFAEIDAATIAARFHDGAEMHPDPALVVSFDDGTARDLSLHRNNGTISGGRPAEGRFGQALQFSARRAAAAKNKAASVPAAGGDRNSLIEPRWNKDVPIYVRAMVLSGSRLFIAGPPDLIDEEATFQQLAGKDQSVETLLATQDDAIAGRHGGKLLAVNADTGDIELTLELNSLPSWDGLAAARGQLLLSTLDGKVVCFAP